MHMRRKTRMRLFASLSVMGQQQIVPIPIGALHYPAFLIWKHWYHCMLVGNWRRGTEQGNRVYCVRSAGREHPPQDIPLIADVVQAPVHYHQVVARSCQMYGLQCFVAHIDMHALGTGKSFDLLASHGAQLDRIDMVTKLSHTDGIRPLASTQIQCSAGATPRSNGEQLGVISRVCSQFDAVPVLPAPPIPFVRSVL